MEDKAALQALRRVKNPPNPYHHSHLEWLDVEPPEVELEIYEEQAKSILSENKSPDVGFRYSVNPYRGCFHGCAYCYARPSHQYLDFGAGTDFERKLIVKTNAPRLLREAFMRPSWRGELIIFSGNTDCYQPLELSYELTRKCLTVCHEFKNPVAIITKGAIIRRDVSLLQALARDASVHVTISLAFHDDETSKLLEPYAPRPSIRLRALRELAGAGIPVGIGLAPVIPGLNDHQIAQILQAAHEHGATTAFMTLVRLPREVKPVFIERLQNSFPNRAKKVLAGIEEMRGGRLNRSDFGGRMHGEGARWEAIEWMFAETCKKLGMNKIDDSDFESKSTFRRPTGQLELFKP